MLVNIFFICFLFGINNVFCNTKCKETNFVDSNSNHIKQNIGDYFNSLYKMNLNTILSSSLYNNVTIFVDGEEYLFNNEIWGTIFKIPSSNKTRLILENVSTGLMRMNNKNKTIESFGNFNVLLDLKSFDLNNLNNSSSEFAFNASIRRLTHNEGFQNEKAIDFDNIGIKLSGKNTFLIKYKINSGFKIMSKFTNCTLELTVNKVKYYKTISGIIDLDVVVLAWKDLYLSGLFDKKLITQFCLA